MPTLAEIRQKFPQYNDLSDAELADRLYTRFYSDMPRAEFNARIGFTGGDPLGLDPTGGRAPFASGFTGAVVRGATFGFGDEAAAAGAGAAGFTKGHMSTLANAPMVFDPNDPSSFTSFGDIWRRAREQQAQAVEAGKQAAGKAYSERLATERKEAERFARTAPALNALGELVGGLGVAAPARAGAATLRAATTATPGGVAKTAAQGAATGAAFGAATGFGGGEGGIENRLEHATIGAMFGGTLGSAIPIIASAVSRVGGTVKNVLGLRDAERAAMDQLLRAFERDGISPSEALRRLDTWVRQGAKGEMLFDLGGENVKRLARAVASVPGTATDTAVTQLARRQAGQAERIAKDIADNLSPSRDFYATLDALRQARAEAARPLYEQAFASGPVHSDRIRQFLDDPITQQGLRRGLEIQRLEALAEGRPFNPSDYAITGFNEAGDPILGQVPNMRLLDAIKRGLDDILEGYRDRVTGRLVLDERGRAIDRVRRAFVNTLDELNPHYKAARQAWSGPSQSMDAMQMGRAIFQKDAEVTEKMIRELSEGDKDFFRAGVVRALQDIIENAPDGADAVKRIFGRPAIRNKLKAAFPDEFSFRRFQRQMEREAALYRNAQFVSPRTGSQTQMRLADEAELSRDPAIGFLGRLAQGQGLKEAAIAQFSQSDLFRRGQGLSSEVGDVLGPLLFNPLPEANRGLLSRMIEEDLERRARILNQQIGARQLGGALGVSVGGLLSDR